ncbi:MAG: 4Fe-4S dicluster domain-containing protein [Thermoguttaceae bacterium]|jgi:MauM/NapG family ferredoxin protein
MVQTAALLLFVGLLFATRRHGDAPVSPWLQALFLIDPLVLLLTWLAAHAVPVALLASLATVFLTMLLGRVFCGWFCPLGTVHAIAGRFLAFCWPQRRRPEHWSRWQLAKYYLLAVLLVMAACGVHWGAVLDPLVLLYRTTTVALLPGVQWAVEDGSEGLGAPEPARTVLREHVTEVERQAFLGSGLIWLLFVAMLVLNRYRPRFWCRYVCPLGALLGVLALRPFLRRRVDHATCNGCDLCGVGCHGAASAAPGDAWKAAECFGCLNCRQSCRRGSLSFQWTLPWRPAPAPLPTTTGAITSTPGHSRRGFLREMAGGACGVAAGGVAGMFLLRATPQSRGATGNQDLIRPPGSLAEREFMRRCTACGMCMKICPTGCLQPSLVEAGLEGIWTPKVEPRIGRCEYDCTLCGQVCPTGAIALLTVEQKHQVKIGIAVLDHSRCIPFAYGRDCGTCVEACPFPEKAIRLVDVEVSVNDGTRQRTKVIGQPMVDPDRCTGCGGCVKECTFKDEPAIRVVSANESRHPGQIPFLDLGQDRAKKGAAAPAAPAPDANPYGT